MPVLTIQPSRRMPRALPVGAALAAFVGALWFCSLPGEQRTAPPLRASATTAVATHLSPAVASAARVDAIQHVAARSVPPMSVSQAHVARSATTPYRFVGRMTIEGETALVFFGRGRTVTLRGPGALDEEFAIDAVLEHQVLLRHVPTSTSHLIEMSPERTNSPPSQSPDKYPQD